MVRRLKLETPFFASSTDLAFVNAGGSSHFQFWARGHDRTYMTEDILLTSVVCLLVAREICN